MPMDEPTVRRPMKPALFALGFSAVVTQLTLMRELLCVYSGNELVIGVVLGNWLLLTGLGAWGGRTSAGLRRFSGVLDIGLLALAVLPLATLIAVRTLRYRFFVRGATVEPTETVLSSLLILMPYCVLSGWLLTACCARTAESSDDARGLGSGYVWDCLGGLAGGLLFSFVLAPRCGHFAMLLLPAVLLTAWVAWTALREGRAGRFGAALFLLGALLSAFAYADPDEWTTAREFDGQTIVFRGYSPYGRLVVTERAGQRDFIQNGVPLFATGDPFPKKETAHLALLQRPEAKRVLLLGGGIAGTAAEILKYPIERLDYVELDPLLIDAARRSAGDAPEARVLSDPRLTIRLDDARRFVRETRERYDVLVVDLPDPSTAQLNRFHTREFFREAHAALAPGGVFSVALGHYENRMTPELEPLIAVPFRTLIEVFDCVSILPGAQRIHFLASDGPLTGDLEARAASRPELAFYPEYLRMWLTRERLEDLHLATSLDAPLNTDLNPRLYYLHLRRTLSQFQGRYGVLLGVLAVATTLFLLRARAAQVGLFAAGFAASALNVVVLLAFQTVHGALYRDLGWLTAAFMLGLAWGAARATRVARDPGPSMARHSAFLRVLLALGVFGALLPGALWLLARLELPFGAPLATCLFYPGLIVALAGLVGAAFPLAACIGCDDAAGAAARSFFADYAGSFLGALLASTILIPVLGVVQTCLLTGLLNLLAAGLIWSRRG